MIKEEGVKRKGKPNHEFDKNQEKLGAWPLFLQGSARNGQVEVCANDVVLCW